MTLPSTNRKRLFGYSSRIVPCPRPVVMRLLTDIHSVTVGRYTSSLVHSLRASMIQKKWSLTDFFVLATLVLPVKSERRSPLRSHTKSAKKCPFNDEYLFFSPFDIESFCRGVNCWDKTGSTICHKSSRRSIPVQYFASFGSEKFPVRFKPSSRF